MPWLSAAVLAAGLMTVVVAAGTTVLRASGVRSRDALGAAPAVGTGVVALSALAGAQLGLPWGVPVVAGGTAVLAVLAAALAGRLHRRRPTGTRPAAHPPTPPAARAARLATPAAVAAGSLLALVPLAVAMVRPDRVHNAWDALFHLAAVDLLRTSAGRGLPDVSVLASPEGGVTYPFAWHALAALAPAGVDPLVATNVAGLVPVVVFGAGGIAALARAAFPGNPSVPPVAAVLSAGALGAPLMTAIQPGLVPNAYALSLVPGVLAWVVRPGRPTTAALVPAVLVAAGVGLSHPGALLGLLLLALPWVAARCTAWVRAPGVRTDAGQRRLLALGSGVLGATIVGALVIGGSSTASAVAGTQVKDPAAAGEIARRLLTGDLGEWPARPWVLVALALTGAVLLARRGRQRPLVAAGLLTVAVYVVAAGQTPFLSLVTAFWYTETRRVAPFVGLVATVLAAYGLVAVTTWAHDAARRRGLTRRGAGVLAVGCSLALTTTALVTGVRAVHGDALDAFTQEVVDDPGPMSRTPYLTADEERMIGRLGGVLGADDLVLGSSFSGAGHLAVLAGTRAVQPYHSWPLRGDAAFVSDRLGDLGRDPAVCQAVRRIGATHVYVDPHPLHSTHWTRAYITGFTTTPGPGARIVDHGGSASVHSLDGCYEDGS